MAISAEELKQKTEERQSEIPDLSGEKIKKELGEVFNVLEGNERPESKIKLARISRNVFWNKLSENKGAELDEIYKGGPDELNKDENLVVSFFNGANALHKSSPQTIKLSFKTPEGESILLVNLNKEGKVDGDRPLTINEKTMPDGEGKTVTTISREPNWEELKKLFGDYKDSLLVKNSLDFKSKENRS